MAIVDPLAEEELPPDLRERVQFFRGPLGVVPSSVRTMAHVPAIAEAFTTLNSAVMAERTRVTPELKRLIGYVSSHASGCLYCQAHMILASERFGASEERLAGVWDPAASGAFTEAEIAALTYARAATEQPSGVTEAMGAELRRHWSAEEAVEITAVVALFGWLNRWNDTMGSALEDLPRAAGEARLAGHGWSAGKHD
jgi:uncharacterized peroxidase-related enzyme